MNLAAALPLPDQHEEHDISQEFEPLDLTNLREVECLYNRVQKALGAEKFFLLTRTTEDFHRALFWPNDVLGMRGENGSLQAFIGITHRPCAFPVGTILSDHGKKMLESNRRAELSMLAIDPQARGQNLSARLIAEGCSAARKARCTTAFARVALANRFGLNAFMKAGFEGIGVTRRTSDRNVELMILARNLVNLKNKEERGEENERILAPTLAALAPALKENFHIVSIVPPTDPDDAFRRKPGEIRHNLLCLQTPHA